MRRILFIIVSVGVSALFLWLVLRDVPLEDVLRSIAGADVLWVLLSLPAIAAGLWARAVRWRGLLGWRIGPLVALHIIGITFLANQLPLRAGEVARSLLAARYGVPVLTAATSIIVERLLDTLLVVLMLAAVLAALPDVQPAVANTALLFGAAALLACTVLLAFARYPDVARRLLAALLARLPLLRRLPLPRLLEQVIDGLGPLTHLRQAAHALGWTLISWAFSLLTLYCLHRALGIHDVDLLQSTVLGIGLASLSIAIPVSIAALGPFQAAIALTGQIVGMAPLQSAALGFLLHGVTIFGYIVMGLAGLLGLGVSPSALLNSARPQARTGTDGAAEQG